MTTCRRSPFVALGPTRRGTPAAILVVDDDDAVRSSVSDILRLEGYEVHEADDGDVALNLLATERFDALVLDDRLPRLDGMEMLAAVENSPPAVIMSNNDVESVGGKELTVRGISYVHKPVVTEHLLDAVATALGRGAH
jgi:two-component system response regulator MprA